MVRMCVRVHVYVYLYTYRMYIYMFVCVVGRGTCNMVFCSRYYRYVYLYVCMYVFVHVRKRVCMHVIMYVCMCCRQRYVHYGILFPILQVTFCLRVGGEGGSFFFFMP